MQKLPRTLKRLANGLRKVSAGLTPFGESVWPGVENDLFVAHKSVYSFFARYVHGKAALDAGCGTGYGCAHLALQGAELVLGVDLDRRSIRYARRHYGSADLQFLVGDCEDLSLGGRTFDVVVSSNMLEHLENPPAFFRSLDEHLNADGVVVLAIPPILSSHDLDRHAGIHYHRANLSVDEWLELFDSSGWVVRLFRHDYTGTRAPDLSSPYRSMLKEERFVFEKSSRDDLYTRSSITAIYELRRSA